MKMLELSVKIQILKKMDKYVRDMGDDDVYYTLWCANAVPDGADETDYENIAEDPDLWKLAVKTFCEIIAIKEERDDF